jgi:hypothetical protein
MNVFYSKFELKKFSNYCSDMVNEIDTDIDLSLQYMQNTIIKHNHKQKLKLLTADHDYQYKENKEKII